MANFGNRSRVIYLLLTWLSMSRPRKPQHSGFFRRPKAMALMVLNASNIWRTVRTVTMDWHWGVGAWHESDRHRHAYQIPIGDDIKAASLMFGHAIDGISQPKEGLPIHRPAPVMKIFRLLQALYTVSWVIRFDWALCKRWCKIMGCSGCWCGLEQWFNQGWSTTSPYSGCLVCVGRKEIREGNDGSARWLKRVSLIMAMSSWNPCITVDGIWAR